MGEQNVRKDEANMIQGADGDIQATGFGQLVKSHLARHHTHDTGRVRSERRENNRRQYLG